MNRAVTVVLALVAVMAIAALYFLRPAGTRELEQRGSRLFDFDLLDVTGIRIQSGNETLEISRDGDTWTLGPRIKDRASPQAISGILNLLQGLEVLDAIPASEFRGDLKSSEFGLAKPKLIVQVLTPDGPQEMRVGKDGVDENQVFVRMGQSENTYLVQDTFRNFFTRPVEAFRDPRLTNLSADRIEKIQIARGPSEIELRRDGAKWRLQRPLRAEANSEKVDQLLERLLGARVLRFLDESNSNALAFELGSENQPEIRFWPEGATEPQVLRLLGPGPEMEGRATQAAWFLPREARIYLADEPLGLSRATVDELRDPIPLRVNLDLVDRIRVKQNENSEAFSRSGETDWVNGAGALNTDRIRALIGALGQLRILNFSPAMDPQKTLQTQESIEIQLDAYVSENTPETTAGTHPVSRLWVGRTADGHVFSRTDSAPELVALTPESWEVLAKSASQLPAETANPTPSPKP